MAQDVSLAEQYPELASLVASNEAEAEKEKGNKAFSEKRSAHIHPPPAAKQHSLLYLSTSNSTLQLCRWGTELG